MILTDSQKAMIATNAKKIEALDAKDLRIYVQKLYMSKADMDIHVFKWLLGVADTRMDVLMERVSVMAEPSELPAHD